MRRLRYFVTAVSCFGFAATVVYTALAADNPQAPPPKFDSAVVDEIFFKDARQHLIGAKPDFSAGPAIAKVPGVAPAGMGGGAPPAAAAGGDGTGWSALVSAETLESEIKAQPGEIDKAMKATNQQKSARMVMTYLATLYGVIFKYDKPDVRWKDSSQAWRDTFAKAGNNLKAWTDTQKKQVSKVQTDLRDLIQGNTPQVATSLDGEAPWLEIADRSPIMHRLEAGQQEHLAGWAKDADSVKKNAEAIIREAEIIAMLARIIQDKSYEYSDDSTYMQYAVELEKQALAAVAATKAGDGAAASSAVSKMQKACDDCHGGFR